MTAVSFARPVAAFSVVLAVLMRPAPVHSAQGCDANSPDAQSFLASASTTFTQLDSLRRLRLGWHSTPKTVTLVTETATCDRVVAAHNKWADGKYAAYKVTRTPIAKAGPSYLVELPPGRGPAERLIFVYDSALNFTTVY